MAKATMQTLSSSRESIFYSEAARQVALVVGGSLFVALCARITIPLPFTPVPLTVQNFGVLVVGLLLGSRRGFCRPWRFIWPKGQWECLCSIPLGREESRNCSTARRRDSC